MPKGLFRLLLYLLRQEIKYILRSAEAEIIFDKEQLDEFSRFLTVEIKNFYLSEKEQKYYSEWLKDHPEYAAAKKAEG